jgi:16S rRNA uridine-516 pseudouridylate synthase and related pseudouridylate synthases
MEERVSKLMARRELCSRREAEQYMERGLVRVNGILVTKPGTKVSIDSEITLNRE